MRIKVASSRWIFDWSNATLGHASLISFLACVMLLLFFSFFCVYLACNRRCWGEKWSLESYMEVQGMGKWLEDGWRPVWIHWNEILGYAIWTNKLDTKWRYYLLSVISNYIFLFLNYINNYVFCEIENFWLLVSRANKIYLTVENWRGRGGVLAVFRDEKRGKVRWF